MRYLRRDFRLGGVDIFWGKKGSTRTDLFTTKEKKQSFPFFYHLWCQKCEIKCKKFLNTCSLRWFIQNYGIFWSDTTGSNILSTTDIQGYVYQNWLKIPESLIKINLVWNEWTAWSFAIKISWCQLAQICNCCLLN